MGYIVAGAMLERLVQVPYETLLVEKYFSPLEISTGGFGAAGTVGLLDEPWGHAPEPFEPEAKADNPIVFSPAGRAHMSVLDFAKHAVFHLRGEPKLLRRETLEFLHTPVSETYALGWGVVEREWAQGRLLTHAGSNGRSFACNVLAPALGFAVVVACNSGTDEALRAVDRAVQAVKRSFLGVNER